VLLLIPQQINPVGIFVYYLAQATNVTIKLPSPSLKASIGRVLLSYYSVRCLPPQSLNTMIGVYFVRPFNMASSYTKGTHAD
jgi:hypothetical protein